MLPVLVLNVKPVDHAQHPAKNLLPPFCDVRHARLSRSAALHRPGQRLRRCRRSEQKAILVPSAEKLGSVSSVALLVSRTGWPPATCRTPNVEVVLASTIGGVGQQFAVGGNSGTGRHPESDVNRVRTTRAAAFGGVLPDSQIAVAAAIAQSAETG